MRIVVQIRFDMRQMMLAFFRDVLGISDPATSFAGAGRFVMPQLTVQRFNKLDPFSQ